MKRDFEQILDECLSQLNTGLDLEAVLARYPEHAAALRPLLETAMLVREAPKPPLSPAVKAAGRRRLLSAVSMKRREVVVPQPSLLERAFSWLPQLSLQPRNLQLARVMVTLSLIVILIASVGVVKVAANSLPDSPLYPVKLTAERVRLILAPAPASKAKLYMNYAEKRLYEARTLWEAGKGLHEGTLEAMQKESQRALTAIGKAPEEHRSNLLADFASLADRQQTILEQIRLEASPSEQEAVGETIAASEEGERVAAEAIEEPSRLLTPIPLPTETATTEPASTATPKPKPTATAIPKPKATATLTPAPPTATSTPTPEVVVPRPTEEPTVEETPQVVVPFLTPEGPVVTPTPEPTATSEPTCTPELTATPEPMCTPVPPTPEATETPQIDVTFGPEALGTPSP